MEFQPKNIAEESYERIEECHVMLIGFRVFVIENVRSFLFSTQP